jgi:hypothetical protein
LDLRRCVSRVEKDKYKLDLTKPTTLGIVVPRNPCIAQPDTIVNSLLYPMTAHVALAATLYALLTAARAPAIWGIGRAPDGSNPWAQVERRISANLSNQFEWPLFFYAACLLLLQLGTVAAVQVWLAWIFVVGRVAHSLVHIFTTNVRLRGIVFTINFLAVLAMWGWLFRVQVGGPQ